METGHAAQNVCLQAQAFNLGVVTVGAFYEDKVQKVIDTDTKPTDILCVGRKK